MLKLRYILIFAVVVLLSVSVFYSLTIIGFRKMKKKYEISAVSERSRLGEAPTYDLATNRVVYIDYLVGDLVLFDIDKNRTDRFHVTDIQISFAIPVKNQPDKFLVSIDGNKLGVFDTVSRRLVSEQRYDLPPGLNFHDGKCDAKGRLWIGGFALGGDYAQMVSGNPPKQSTLYRVVGSELKQVADGFVLSNGLTWNKANTKLFFADSVFGVYVFDFDLERGEISNKRLLIDSYKIPGYKKPDRAFLNGDFIDGMTIDAFDNLWLANYGAGKVCKFDTTTGELLDFIEMPVKTVTSLTFGGRDFTELYVTSYWDLSWATDTHPFDDDLNYGMLYRVRSKDEKFRGLPMHQYLL